MNLLALNTKTAGYAGVITFLVSLWGYNGFQVDFQKLLTAPCLTQWLAILGVALGYAATYYGKPHTVPEPPNPAPPTTPFLSSKGP